MVEGYAIEGHVPVADIDRLLQGDARRPRGWRSPACPLGSPGMEAEDGATEPYDVMLFGGEGRRGGVRQSLNLCAFTATRHRP